ncbi:hypothetical protein BJ165DRAFT_1471167 [Panaeolus papilionaceus]|nr:hypothetical protein BJ165DRAFT_1471167 [Panaeolus papilionaceus]
MNARFARNAFATARRSAQSTTSASLAARVVRRPMSASASHGPTKSSDTPWIVGSLLVFGPMFLYLVSPSARKSQAAHTVHHDKREYPTLHKEVSETHAAPPAEPASKQPAPEIMTDDEGTPANVAESNELAQASDVPNDSQSTEDHASIKDAAGSANVDNASAPSPDTSAAEQTVKDSSKKSATMKNEGEDGALDQGSARGASTEGLDPKPADEKAQKDN